MFEENAEEYAKVVKYLASLQSVQVRPCFSPSSPSLCVAEFTDASSIVCRG